MFKRFIKKFTFVFSIVLTMSISACSTGKTPSALSSAIKDSAISTTSSTTAYNTDKTASTDKYIQGKSSELLKLSWNGKTCAIVNNNKSQFDKRYKTYEKVWLKTSALDKYERPGTIMAVLGKETMNFGEREDIGMYKPAGWITAKYTGVIKSNYLYNRSHLIAQSLAAGKSSFSNKINSKVNLVTGTRYMNYDGMVPYEDKIYDCIKKGKLHVVYRVQPVYKDSELVCRGVWMQAYSLEDKGKSVDFNVYCFNVQPGIEIDYSDGSSSLKTDYNKEMEIALANGAETVENDGTSVQVSSGTTKSGKKNAEKKTYILNTSSKKFHLPDCENINAIKEKNKKTTKTTRDLLIKEGYSPCKTCNP